jgi:hypothetical protein
MQNEIASEEEERRDEKYFLSVSDCMQLSPRLRSHLSGEKTERSNERSEKK